MRAAPGRETFLQVGVGEAAWAGLGLQGARVPMIRECAHIFTRSHGLCVRRSACPVSPCVHVAVLVPCTSPPVRDFVHMGGHGPDMLCAEDRRKGLTSVPGIELLW